jgi:hypothetical protein
MNFDVTDQLLMINYAFIRYRNKEERINRVQLEVIRSIGTYYNSTRIEFGTPMKLFYSVIITIVFVMTCDEVPEQSF